MPKVLCGRGEGFAVNPTFRRLLREARPFYPRLIAGTLFGVVAGVAPLTLAKVAGYLRADVLVPHPSWDVLWLIIVLIVVSQILGRGV